MPKIHYPKDLINQKTSSSHIGTYQPILPLDLNTIFNLKIAKPCVTTVFEKNPNRLKKTLLSPMGKICYKKNGLLTLDQSWKDQEKGGTDSKMPVCTVP